MSREIELSCDLGEAQSDEEREIENAIWPLIGAANVACGGHVGDESSMRDAVERCVARGTTLGAHPSYPDREGFGRRHVDMPDEDLVASLEEQLLALQTIAAGSGIEVERVKPHGALYNEAQKDERLARLVVQAVASVLPAAAVVCAAESEVRKACQHAGLATIREAFVDRRYRTDGSLQPRGEAGALILDVSEAADQAARLATSGTVVSTDGSVVKVDFETLCAHSDMPGSVERIRAVRARLSKLGLALT